MVQTSKVRHCSDRHTHTHTHTLRVMSSEQEASRLPVGSHLMAFTSFCGREVEGNMGGRGRYINKSVRFKVVFECNLLEMALPSISY